MFTLIIFVLMLTALCGVCYAIGYHRRGGQAEQERADELEISCMASDILDKLMEQYAKNWRLRRALAQVHIECGYEQNEARNAIREIEQGGRLKLKKFSGVQ